MKDKILVSSASFGKYGRRPQQLLEEAGYEVVLNNLGRQMTPEEVIEFGRDCIGIVASVEPLNARVLESLPRLRCVSRLGVGIDNIDLDKARELGIVIRNTPDAPTRAVAELAVGLVFDVLRNISHCDREMRQGRWYKYMGNLLHQKKVGILGLGRIGRLVAEMLQKLGAEVAGADIKPDREWAEANGIVLMSMTELLRESDIICLHISYAEDNYHIIGSKELESMKKGAYLVNLSRGGIVDEDALYRALKSKHLTAAAIDVFEHEPYSGPLTELDNMVLTPHYGSNAVEARLDMEMQAVRNLIESLKS